MTELESGESEGVVVLSSTFDSSRSDLNKNKKYCTYMNQIELSGDTTSKKEPGLLVYLLATQIAEIFSSTFNDTVNDTENDTENDRRDID